MKPRYMMAVGAYCAAIFVLSSQSEAPDAAQSFLDFPGSDKVAHVILYAGLAATVSVGVKRSNGSISPRLLFWLPVAFSALYGVSDEVHQLFVPQRTLDPMDVLADVLGAMITQIALCGFLWRSPPVVESLEAE